MPYGRKKRGNLKPHQSSLILNLKPIMAARGIENKFSFLLKSGVSRNSAVKMLKGKAVQINFRQITAICTALNCTPNDIFVRRQMNHLPEHHALNALSAADAPQLPTIAAWMQGKTFEEIKQVLSAPKTPPEVGE